METKQTLEAHLAFVKNERATLPWIGYESMHEQLMLEEAQLVSKLFWKDYV